MRYILHGNFYTDGDYCIELTSFTNKKYKEIISYDSDNQCYKLYLETYEVTEVEKFLEELITCYRARVSYYYLIKDLYEMTYEIHKVLHDDSVDYKQTTMSGNYSGTHLMLLKSPNKN